MALYCPESSHIVTVLCDRGSTFIYHSRTALVPVNMSPETSVSHLGYICATYTLYVLGILPLLTQHGDHTYWEGQG